MATTVFGVGVGLFILMSVWFVAICIGLVSLRTHRNTGTIAVVSAAIITVILLLVPLDSKNPTPAIYKIYDELFIWRSSLVILLGVSSIAGSVSFLIKYLMEPLFARPIKDKRN